MTDPFYTQLLPASFRGVAFHVSAASESTGRRFQRFEFPGRDAPAHEDMGAGDGPVKLTALLIGADVLDQVAALKRAVRQPGPGRLVHPWAGEFEAVIAPGSLPEFSWDEKEGRVARVTLTFERTGASDPQGQGAGLPRLPAASPAASAGVWQAGAALLAVQTTTALLGLAGQALTLAAQLERRLNRRLKGGLAPAIRAASLRLSRIGTSPGALTAGYPAAGPDLVQCLTPQRPPALAGVSAPAGLTPAQQSGMVLALVETAADQPPVLGLLLTAAAAAAAPLLSYDSREAALGFRDRLTAAAATHAGDITRLPAQTETGESGARAMLWQSAMDLRDATYQDLSRRAGTLPPVRYWQCPAGTPALVGLQRLFGDDPASLPGRLKDLVQRNPVIRHPGSLPAARLEILDR